MGSASKEHHPLVLPVSLERAASSWLGSLAGVTSAHPGRKEIPAARHSEIPHLEDAKFSNNPEQVTPFPYSGEKTKGFHLH